MPADLKILLHNEILSVKSTSWKLAGATVWLTTCGLYLSLFFFMVF